MVSTTVDAGEPPSVLGSRAPPCTCNSDHPNGWQVRRNEASATRRTPRTSGQEHFHRQLTALPFGTPSHQRVETKPEKGTPTEQHADAVKGSPEIYKTRKSDVASHFTLKADLFRNHQILDSPLLQTASRSHLRLEGFRWNTRRFSNSLHIEEDEGGEEKGKEKYMKGGRRWLRHRQEPARRTEVETLCGGF